MTTLNLDEKTRRRVHHAAENYGVEVYGGSPEDREAALRDVLEGPFVTVDCREVEDSEELVVETLLALGADQEEVDKMYKPGNIELRRALQQSEKSFLVLEFDSMSFDAKRSVAQMMKGVCEQGFPGHFGYACEESGEVVRANSDMAGRMTSYEVDENAD